MSRAAATEEKKNSLTQKGTPHLDWIVCVITTNSLCVTNCVLDGQTFVQHRIQFLHKAYSVFAVGDLSARLFMVI